MDCSLPGSSLHGILQARVLEWVAISFSRGSSRPGIEPRSPSFQADALTYEPPGKAFLSLPDILWNSAFKWLYLFFSHLPLASLVFPAICKDSSDNHFAFLHFFFGGMVLIPASCTMSQTSIQSYQECYLSDLIPWIYLSFPPYNHKGFDLGHTWMV